MSKILIVAAIALLVSCSKMAVYDSYSDTLSEKIEQFKTSSYTCMDAKIDMYKLGVDTVFIFDSGTCYPDDEDVVYNNCGEEMGAIGGNSRNFKINNMDFAIAEKLQTVWHK